MRSIRAAWPLAAALLAGLFLGVLLLERGAVLPLAGIGAAALVWVTVSRAEAVLLLLLAFATSLIPGDLNLSVRLAVVNVYVTDLLFMPLLAVLLLRLLLRDGWRWRSTPLDLPLLLFLGATVSGMLTASLTRGVPLADTTYEAHFLLYYVAFFLVTNMVRRPEQLRRLVIGGFAIALLVALTIVVQGLGVAIPFVSASILRTDEGVIRMFHPGGSLLFHSLIVVTCYLLLAGAETRLLPIVSAGGLLAVALAMGLSRNTLIAAAVGLLVGVIILRGRHLSRLMVPGILLLAIIGAVLWLETNGQSSFLGRYLEAYGTRVSRMLSGDLLTDADTLNWRLREVEYAVPLVRENPVLGIGLSVPYRPPFYVTDPLTRYIHNSYLWLWLKTGLVGLVAFLWLSYRFLTRSLRLWQGNSSDLMQALVLGTGLAFLGDMLSNLVAPSFVQDWGSLVYPLLLGAVECALMAVPAPALAPVRREVAPWPVTWQYRKPASR